MYHDTGTTILHRHYSVNYHSFYLMQGLGGVGEEEGGGGMLPPGMMLMPDANSHGHGHDMTGVVVVPTLPQNGDQNLQDDLAVSDDSEEEEEEGGQQQQQQQQQQQFQQLEQQQQQPPDGDDVMSF